MANKSISLKNVLVASKTVTAEVPGYPGFEIDLSYLSRELVSDIRKKCTTRKFTGGKLVETTDDQLFLQLYVKNVIKGWRGLKLSYLVQLAPVDLGDYNPDDELEYSEEDALYLMKSSSTVDSWVSEQVSDLGNFQSNKEKK